MNIPFFHYPHVATQHGDELQAALSESLLKGAFILQEEVALLERELAAFVGAKHAVGTANATDALILCLLAAGIGPGDRVIVPSHTFVATAAAVKWAGGEPVLADCAPSDHLLDVDSLRRAAADGARFVMPVQLNGRVAEMHAIEAAARDLGLEIIEDSAQALGARFREAHAGTFGRAGVFSFYPAKLLGCFGDGGMIVTNDDDIAARVRLMRDHGRSGHGEDVECWGVNSRLDNIQAAVLRVKLKHLPADIARRREIASAYDARLSGIGTLHLPPPPDDGEHFDVFQNYELEADGRDDLRQFLQSRGIGTAVQWGGKAIHQFEGLGFDVSLPNTEAFFERCLMLPMNTSLIDEEVDYICGAVEEFYGN